MKFHKHINSNELSVLVLFSRSQDFIPGITFKDVLRFEERNKNVFFLNSEGNRRQYLKKKIGDIKTPAQRSLAMLRVVFGN
jgi:hypothetical protein